MEARGITFTDRHFELVTFGNASQTLTCDLDQLPTFLLELQERVEKLLEVKVSSVNVFVTRYCNNGVNIYPKSGVIYFIHEPDPRIEEERKIRQDLHAALHGLGR